MQFYSAQVALALGQLHRGNILYRDVKPENILMDSDGYVALTDFGLSKVVAAHDSTRTFVGTPEYIAPEIIKGAGHNKPADWWSFGILMFELLIGVPPFRHKNQHMLYDRITHHEIVFPDPKKYGIIISDAGKDLISRLLCKEPEGRMGTKKDAEEVLGHPFFAGMDMSRLLAKQLVAEFVLPPEEEATKAAEEHLHATLGEGNGEKMKAQDEGRKYEV